MSLGTTAGPTWGLSPGVGSHLTPNRVPIVLGTHPLGRPGGSVFWMNKDSLLYSQHQYGKRGLGVSTQIS